MTQLNPKIADIPLPPYMQKLPLDKRGFPVPWFTPWDKTIGDWNFQAIEPGKTVEAVRKHVCWVCGSKLFRNLAYVLGPMCAITRTSAEVACHVECAEYSVKACPFLSQPRMRRPTLNKAEYHNEDGTPRSPGFAIERNPGVSLVWVTRSFKPMHTSGGMLISVGDPIRQPEAWKERRRATDAELIHSIVTGLPNILRLVDTEDDMAEFKRRMAKAWEVLRLPGLWEAAMDTAITVANQPAMVQSL